MLPGGRPFCFLQPYELHVAACAVAQALCKRGDRARGVVAKHHQQVQVGPF